MKKRIISVLIVIMMLVSVVPFTVSADSSQIKNIIYLIPDGGGYGPYDFADMVKQAGGFDVSKYPNKTPSDTSALSMKGQLAGSMITSPVTGGVTDSSAAGTALATGYKTINGMVGINQRRRPIANLVEAAEYVGKATGVISTYEWMHATPAAFTSHTSDRNDYYNIYQQVENKGMEVVLGAGYGAVSGYASIQNAVDRGYKVVNNKNELLAVKPGEKVWGNLYNNSSPYDINLSATQPTLAEMTSAAITALSGDSDGFFLMVEGGKVDTGGHANDAVVTTSEYIAFDAAFKVALDFAKGRTDTVIICVPDHDTGGMVIKSDMSSEVAKVKTGVNPTTITWDSPNHTDQNVGVWMYVPQGISVIPGLNSVLGDTVNTRTNYVIDNTAIAPYLANLMGVNLDTLSSELFVDVTDIGVYMATTGKFTFNNGNKYAYANQNVYHKDGNKINIKNGQLVAVDGRIYAPQEIIEEGDWDKVTEDYDGITGSGTIVDPYVINDAYDFIEFTGNMLQGETYAGKYLRQDANINLAGNTDYPGIGQGYTFAGTYNGNGHVINVGIDASGDRCLFPYTTGTIYNLGVTGTVYNTSYGAALCRSLRAGGKIVNCWSTANVTSNFLGGIAWSNYGTIENCFYGGVLSGPNKYSVASAQGSEYKFKNTYYLNTCGVSQSVTGIEEVTDTVARTTLADILNAGRQSAAATLGVSIEDIHYWTNQNGLPQMYIPTPTVSSVTVSPATATVNKGDGAQFTATVTGEFNPSSQVIWSIEGNVTDGTYISSDGYLVVSANETAENFTVMAKSKQDGSKSGIARVTVGNAVISEQDGSRARPFLIGTAAEFKAFSDGMISGKNYEGLYFKQTANIDMAGISGYTGVGSGQKFNGFYDGNGYTINIAIDSSADGCLFPYTAGTIINLGVTGYVNNTSYAGGICRSLRAGGIIANCWSDVDINAKDLGGVVWSNYGTLTNCYTSGSFTTSNTMYSVAQIMSGAVTLNNYFVGEMYVKAGDVTEITPAQLNGDLAMWLNNGIADAARITGIPESDFKVWEKGPERAIFKTEKITAELPGDVNGDGKITVYDVYVILQYLQGDVTLTPKQLVASTLGDDVEAPTIEHALRILNYVARLTLSL